jgi:hypothetical protein
MKIRKVRYNVRGREIEMEYRKERDLERELDKKLQKERDEDKKSKI